MTEKKDGQPRSVRLAEQVKEDLISRISSGELGPGDRLPAERVLAQDLGVSRNVVREAIQSLTAMNLLDARPGAGVFVATLDTESLMSPLAVAMSLRPGTLRTVMQARLVLEPGIARLAARLAAAEDIDNLERLVHHSSEVVDDPAAFPTLDAEIHTSIVRMARNPILTRMSEGIGRLARASRSFTNPDPEMRHHAARDHEAIFAAIAAHDEAAAEEAMRRHLEDVEAHLLKAQRELELKQAPKDQGAQWTR